MNQENRPAPLPKISVAETEEERHAIYELSYRVFIEEMGLTFDEADNEKKRIQDELDETAVHLFQKTEDGKIVAAMRLNFGGDAPISDMLKEIFSLERFRYFPEDTFSFGSRLIVEPSWRGDSVLGRLVCAAYDKARERDSQFNFVFCAPGLLHMYECLGYRRYKGNIDRPDLGYCVPLVLIMEDKKHLRAVGSPFYRSCRKLENSPKAAEWFEEKFPGYVGFINQRTMDTEDMWLLMSQRLHSKDVPLLRDLTEEESKKFMTAASVLHCRKGDWILREGDSGIEMFVILSGAVEVRTRVGEQRISLRTFGKGEIFGEIAFLTKKVRSANVVALTELELLIITKPFLQKIMKNMPDIAAKILYNLSIILSERLMMSTKQWVLAIHESKLSDRASLD